MGTRLERDARILDLLRAQFRPHRLAETRRNPIELRHQRLVERFLDRLLAQHAQLGEAHAVGRQDRGVGVDEDPADAEQVGDLAGMLRAGAAEAARVRSPWSRRSRAGPRSP